jgi:small subunit ribosomal protein S16
MLKIRLTRRGKKNKAFFRLVVAEHTSPIKGKFIEVLGFLNPHTKEKGLKDDRIKYWIEKGAQCSDSAHNFLVTNGVIDGPKRAVKMKKKAEDVKTEPTSAAGSGEAKEPKETEKPVEEGKTEESKTEEAKPAEKEPPVTEEKTEEKSG